MNLALIKENIAQISEIKPIGKTVIIGGVIYNVIGLTLQADGELQLLVLEYDDEYRNNIEQAELDGIYGMYEKPATNRDEQRRAVRFATRSHFMHADKVFFDNREFKVKGSSGCVCSVSQWEMAVLFARFLVCGWEPAGIDTENLDYMYLTRISLDGTYALIPDIASPADIRFSLRSVSKSYLAEIPITLEIGGEYNEKLFFTDSRTGQERWLQINDVCLFDLWEHFDNLFADPRVKEFASEDELEKQKIHIAETFADLCPKGMRFITVDYECGDDISVQFFSKRWLGSAPRHNSGSSGSVGLIGFGKSGNTTGKLGMKMKTAVIQEPFPPDIRVIEAELFMYHAIESRGDITVDTRCV